GPLVSASELAVGVSGRTTLGGRGRLASRIQPNHPRDGLDGVLASTLEGLSYACGDAVVGVNPADDRVEVVERLAGGLQDLRERLGAPTQVSVLAHVTTQLRALEAGAPLDLIFQSVGGTAAANRAFGVDLALLDDADAAVRARGRLDGAHRWYFETGQGSELSSHAHAGLDQVTLEARCYGVARRYRPLLVNSVVGFIGPEYLYDARQVLRAGLEDHLMGKLLGVPMGVDVCYTNHMAADQNDLESLAVLLAASGCNYFMAVPMGDDCMLGYQTSSFHDASALRELLDLRPAPEFEAWLETRGLMEDGRLTALGGDPRPPACPSTSNAPAAPRPPSSASVAPACGFRRPRGSRSRPTMPPRATRCGASGAPPSRIACARRASCWQPRRLPTGSLTSASPRSGDASPRAISGASAPAGRAAQATSSGRL